MSKQTLTEKAEESIKNKLDKIEGKLSNCKEAILSFFKKIEKQNEFQFKVDCEEPKIFPLTFDLISTANSFNKKTEEEEDLLNYPFNEPPSESRILES